MLFSEYQLWLLLAIGSTVLFISKIVMMLFLGGDHGDFDHSFDHHTDSSDAFEIISIQSIIAFFMGASWMGLTLRFQWEQSLHWSILGASFFGIFILLLFSLLMKNVKKLNHKTNATFLPHVGTRGQVYLTIPAAHGGTGQIQIVTDGKLNIIDALQDSPYPIESHASVEVIEVRNNTVVVQKIS